MFIIKKVNNTNTYKSSFIFGFVFALASFLVFAFPSSASAVTWCSKDPGNVVHVFSSGSACTKVRQASWNICGTCAVWCSVGKDKKAVNVFPTNATCTQSIKNSGVSGGICRQCTATDITNINNKLKPYYPKTYTSNNSNGFLFNFGTNGLYLGGYGSGYDSSSYTPLSFLNTPTQTTPVSCTGLTEKDSWYWILSCADNTPYCSIGSNGAEIKYANYNACLSAQNSSVGAQGCSLCANNPNPTAIPTQVPNQNSNPTSGTGAGTGNTVPLNGQTTGANPLSGQTTGSGNCGGTGGIPNPLGNTCTLYALFSKILTVAQEIGGVIIVLAIIYTGFLFVKAQGNSEELETAKRAFTWTVIGAAILLGSTVLSKIIENTINQLK